MIAWIYTCDSEVGVEQHDEGARQSCILLPCLFNLLANCVSESALRIRWPKYWSFRFSISPSRENSELISFRIAWFNLLAVQGTFKSLLQYHSLKASILQRLAFFMVWLSHLSMTTGKTMALAIQTYVSLILSISSAPTPASVRGLPYCWVLAWCTWSVQC